MKKLLFLASLIIALSASPVRGQSVSFTLDKIRTTQVITFGYAKDSAPFSFLGNDGKPTGYSVDLCLRVATAIQQQLKLSTLQIKWVAVDTNNRIPSVVDGTIDLECGTTTNTLSRQEQVDFSLMTFVDGGGIMVKTKSPVRHLPDLAGKKIVVTSGTTTEKRLRETLLDKHINAEIIVVHDQADGMAALERNKVDAYANDRLILIGSAMKTKNPKDYSILDEDFSFEPYGLMMRRGDPDFRLAVNRALSQLYRTGQIEEIFQRWLGNLGRPGVLLYSMYYLNGLPE